MKTSADDSDSGSDLDIDIDSFFDNVESGNDDGEGDSTIVSARKPTIEPSKTRSLSTPFHEQKLSDLEAFLRPEPPRVQMQPRSDTTIQGPDDATWYHVSEVHPSWKGGPERALSTPEVSREELWGYADYCGIESSRFHHNWDLVQWEQNIIWDDENVVSDRAPELAKKAEEFRPNKRIKPEIKWGADLAHQDPTTVSPFYKNALLDGEDWLNNIIYDDEHERFQIGRTPLHLPENDPYLIFEDQLEPHYHQRPLIENESSESGSESDDDSSQRLLSNAKVVIYPAPNIRYRTTNFFRYSAPRVSSELCLPPQTLKPSFSHSLCASPLALFEYVERTPLLRNTPGMGIRLRTYIRSRQVDDTPREDDTITLNPTDTGPFLFGGVGYDKPLMVLHTNLIVAPVHPHPTPPTLYLAVRDSSTGLYRILNVAQTYTVGQVQPDFNQGCLSIPSYPPSPTYLKNQSDTVETRCKIHAAKLAWERLQRLGFAAQPREWNFVNHTRFQACIKSLLPTATAREQKILLFCERELMSTPWRKALNIIEFYQREGNATLDCASGGDCLLSFLSRPLLPFEDTRKPSDKFQELTGFSPPSARVGGGYSDMRRIPLRDLSNLLAGLGVSRQKIATQPRWAQVQDIQRIVKDRLSNQIHVPQHYKQYVRVKALTRDERRADVLRRAAVSFENQIAAIRGH